MLRALFIVFLPLLRVALISGVSIDQGMNLLPIDLNSSIAEIDSVALSADGNTLACGSASVNGSMPGIWVFTRSSGQIWAQQGTKLVGNNSSISLFSESLSVALSSDGNTLASGRWVDSQQMGAVWVFVRNGASWSQQGAKLVGTGAIGSYVEQGTSVALNSDGNTLASGGPGDSGFLGAVWIFARNGTSWSQQATKLVGTSASGAMSFQGSSVALNSDGNTLASGGFSDSQRMGAVWIFIRTGQVWTQQGGKLVGTGAIGPLVSQGISVALSSDGNTLASGGREDNELTGAVWIFSRQGNTWSQEGMKLVGTNNGGISYQGAAVAMSSDGNIVVSGAVWGMWVFARHGSATSFVQVLEVANVSSRPTAIALSSDGTTLADGSLSGAWIFTLTDLSVQGASGSSNSSNTSASVLPCMKRNAANICLEYDYKAVTSYRAVVYLVIALTALTTSYFSSRAHNNYSWSPPQYRGVVYALPQDLVLSPFWGPLPLSLWLDEDQQSLERMSLNSNMGYMGLAFYMYVSNLLGYGGVWIIGLFEAGVAGYSSVQFMVEAWWFYLVGAAALGVLILTSYICVMLYYTSQYLVGQVKEAIDRARPEVLAAQRARVEAAERARREQIQTRERLEAEKKKRAEEASLAQQRAQEERTRQAALAQQRALEERNRQARIEADARALARRKLDGVIAELQRMGIGITRAQALAVALTSDGFDDVENLKLVGDAALRKAGANGLEIAKIIKAMELIERGPTTAELRQHPVGPEKVNSIVEKAIIRLKKKRAIFISYHQMGAAQDANVIYDFLIGHGFSPQHIFFDKTTLRDMRLLRDEVKNAAILLQLQSSELLYRPFCLIEACQAITANVTIIPIALDSYNYKEAEKFMAELDFGAALERMNSGAVQILRDNGMTPEEVGYLMRREVPKLRSFPFTARSTKGVIEAQLKDILGIVMEVLQTD